MSDGELFATNRDARDAVRLPYFWCGFLGGVIVGAVAGGWWVYRLIADGIVKVQA